MEQSYSLCSNGILKLYELWLLFLQSKGFEVIACVSVNDAFVMAAWGNESKATGKVS